ncbi:MAG: PspA/IM30 family protein [Spirochaetaceae bacterium]|jgi:phage shock protein A|nr:PspA/IM30 family protein [Spirochaetaceae bacterium]
MGIFSRLKTVIESHVNSLISKAEKPEKMLNQLLIDMNNQLIDSKRAVAQAIADEKKLEREFTAQEAQAQDWERKAMLAVKAGDDELAKEALNRKQECANNAAVFKKQYDIQKESVDKLKVSLKALQGKIDEAQRKKNLLIARAKRAEAQQKIQATVSKVSGNNSSFEAFDRMAQKVDQLEAENDANLELENLNGDADLEARFAQLEAGDTSADKMLLELKEKMKALPPGENI